MSSAFQHDVMEVVSDPVIVCCMSCWNYQRPLVEFESFFTDRAYGALAIDHLQLFVVDIYPSVLFSQ